MILILLGPPGSGKGTQAKQLAAQKKWAHLSTGDMLRAAITAGSQIGLEAKSYIDKGLLVPDDVVVGLIAERIKNPDCKNGFILDGFPRNMPQAEILDKMMSQAGLRIDQAVLFEISQDELVKRLSGRRTCTGCGAMYHVESAKPKVNDVCDHCGKPLIRRSDDQPEVIRKRLSVYVNDTAPLTGYYRKQNRLQSIDASQAPAQVSEQLARVLRDYGVAKV